MKLKDKNLLILTEGYPSEDGKTPAYIFVKEQVDELKKYFKKIYVIAPTPYFPKALGSLNCIPDKFKYYIQFNNYNYDNVKVFFPRFFTIPINYFRYNLGKIATRTVARCIKKNNLKFDLIHSHFTHPTGYIGVKIKKTYNKKLILTTHGLHAIRYNDLVKNKKAK